MDFQYAIYEKRGHIGYITLNRPEVMNALHPPADLELSDIWDDFERDPEMWVAILTGAGKAFSAGRDLKFEAEHGGMPWDRSRAGELRRGKGAFAGLVKRFEMWKPVIGAVNGVAYGGGMELALACDILIASENARFGLREPRHGFMSGAGVFQLTRQLPLKIAMGLILTAKTIDAQEAYRIGLVDEVVPLPELIPTAERWAQEIMECAPLAVRGSKEAAMSGLQMPLELAMKHHYANVLALVRSEDFTEGPRAFAEKRKPEWKGR